MYMTVLCMITMFYIILHLLWLFFFLVHKNSGAKNPKDTSGV